jgi:hypothetical protein
MILQQPQLVHRELLVKVIMAVTLVQTAQAVVVVVAQVR